MNLSIALPLPLAVICEGLALPDPMSSQLRSRFGTSETESSYQGTSKSSGLELYVCLFMPLSDLFGLLYPFRQFIWTEGNVIA